MIAWQSQRDRSSSQAVNCVGENRAFTSVSTDTRTLQARRVVRRAAGARTSMATNSSRPLPSAARRRRWLTSRCRWRCRRWSSLIRSQRCPRSRANGDVSSTFRVIGVTGSNGKTTTKELIGSILSRLGPTLVTRGNLNNHIGVPLTLLELTAAHRYAVIEMGANHIGRDRASRCVSPSRPSAS